MKHRSLAAVALLLVLSLILGSCSPAKTSSSSSTSSSTDPYANLQEESCPHTSGTFIQSWLCSSWTDERWEQELSHYQQIGIKYIILGDTTTYDETTQKWSYYYPTEIPEIKSGKCYSTTLFDDALRNCQKYGMKVFIGMGLINDYTKHITDSDWLTKSMNMNNQICTELYNLYYEKYSDTFYGWYWPYEIWNDTRFGKFSDNRVQSIQALADAMSICLDHINELNPDLPMMWSPYVNPSMMSADETSAFWRDIISEGHFRAGDILCPMDSINNFNYKLDGKGGCTIFNIDKYELGYREAVDDSGKGVKYWSNCESFNSKVEPAEPALWARYVRQMQTVSKYTDTIVTFAYAHYYSPYTVNSCFANTYMDYLQNGKLETEPPTAPTNLTYKVQNNSVVLSWDPSTDNFGVAGYYVYREGAQIEQYYTQIQHPESTLATTAMDSDLSDILARKGSVTYEVMAYDSAGNYSDKASVTVTQDDFNKQ